MYRRNPTLFGQQMSAGKMGTAIIGGLVGVTVAKMLPPSLPPQLTSSPLMRVAITAGAAILAGWAAGKFFNQPEFGNFVMFGGLMQAGSVALNAFLPGVGRQIGLSGGPGMGYLIDGSFAEPENPVMRGVPAVVPPTQMRVGVSGLSRAFAPAF